MALQWVRDNIESFGGDPGNVMIFGQSGGGGKVVRMLHMPAAKGLFHKVAAQSGGNNTYRTTDPAASIKAQQTIAAHTLKNLNLTGDQIDKLKTVPYSALITAGIAALRSAAQEVGRPTLNWEVIADDQYVMREFCDWADPIPLMAGAVFSEMQGTLTRGDGRKNEWSQKEIDDQLTAAFGDKKNDIVAEFKQAFPRKKVQDVLYYAGALAPGREEPAGAQARKDQDAGLQLPVRLGIPDQWRHHVLPLLRARVLLPRPERAADPDGDRRRCGRHGPAGQGLAGVDQLRADRQSQPAGTRMEAVYEGEPAGDGVRHRQPVGRAPRRQAGVAAAGSRRSRRNASSGPRERAGSAMTTAATRQRVRESFSRLPGHLVRRVHQVATAYFAEECGADLTAVQDAALVAIGAHPGIDATRLSEIIYFDRSTIGDVLDRMEGKGWILRYSTPSDRRLKRLELSPAGQEALHQVEPGIRRVQDRLLAALTAAEAKTLIRLLAKVADGGEEDVGND